MARFPNHIGVIPDGKNRAKARLKRRYPNTPSAREEIPTNGTSRPSGSPNRRWAQQNGMKKEDGYRYGLSAGLNLLRAAKERGVGELTYYGFIDPRNRTGGKSVFHIPFPTVVDEQIDAHFLSVRFRLPLCKRQEFGKICISGARSTTIFLTWTRTPTGFSWIFKPSLTNSTVTAPCLSAMIQCSCATGISPQFGFGRFGRGERQSVLSYSRRGGADAWRLRRRR